MKQILYILPFVVLAVVGCSNDETLDSSGSNEITFNVTTDNATRSNTFFTASSKAGFSDFTVYAYNVTNDVPFIRDWTVKRTTADYTSGYFYGDGESYYWPSNTNTKIDFIAYRGVNSDATVDLAKDSYSNNIINVTGFELPEDAANQNDFVYAEVRNQSQGSATNGRLDMKFKHALAAIQFTGQCDNKHIYVYIKSIAIKNITNTGDVKFEAQLSSDEDDLGVKWSNNTSNKTKSTRLQFGPDAGTDESALAAIYYIDNTESNEALDITDDPRTVILQVGMAPSNYYESNDANYNNGVLLAVPQTTAAWQHGDADTYANNQVVISNGTKGAYAEIELCIYNIADVENKIGTYDPEMADFFMKYPANEIYKGPDEELPIFGSLGNFKKILIPIDATWKAGYKYVYNLRFGTDTNNAYSADDPSQPGVELVPIDLDLSAQYVGWVDGAATDHVIREDKKEDTSSNDDNN